MKAIIFGITGQDGSYLAELLLSKGYEVVGVTRRTSTPNTSNINHILQNIVLVEGDVTDGFNVAKIIEEHRPDEVYNLAAQSHVGTSFKQPNLTWDITAGGVLNILEAIRYSDRKDKIRFYQASSSEMFGKNFSTTKGRFGDIKFQDENTPFVPQSPYAIAKLAAHHLVRNYREGYGIHGSCGILFNHESERRGEKFVTRKITKWIGEYHCWQDSVYSISETNRYETDEDNIIINGNYFPKLRLGNLDAKRDWGHAQDYVNAMWLMLQQDTADDYVVGTGETYSVRDFLDAAFNHIDIDDWSSCVVVDPEFYRPAEVDYLLGIPKKAETTLGWERDVSFTELAERMVDSDVEKARLRRSGLQAVSS
jgi:GDPmannose 4,6-dehydratase